MNKSSERVQQAVSAILEAKATLRTGRMVTWVTCAIIGKALAPLSPEEQRQARKELASDGDITERYVEMHQRIWRVWEAAGLPDEAMEIVKHATVRYCIETWGPEEATKEIIAIHDGDESLFKANLRRLKERLKAAKAEGHSITTREAILEALGPLGVVSLELLNETDRRQILRAISEVLGEGENHA